MKDLAIKAVREGGRILLENFGKVHKIEQKLPHDFATDVDKKVEKVILDILNESEYSIVSEEAGEKDKGSEFKWVVDPLDGTTNFILGNTMVSSAVALLKGREVILSAAYAPFTKELFYAEKGKGFFLNNEKKHVSDIDRVENSFLLFCNGKELEYVKKTIEVFRKLKLVGKDLRQFGSASLEFGTVAAGRAECIIIPGVNVFDAAPGLLFVKEAGGMITDFSGNEFTIDFSCKDVLASNGKVHDKILEILKGL